VSDAASDGVTDFGPPLRWLSGEGSARGTAAQRLRLRRGPVRVTAEPSCPPGVAPTPSDASPPVPASRGPSVSDPRLSASCKVWPTAALRSRCLGQLAAAVAAAASSLRELDVGGLLGHPVGGEAVVDDAGRAWGGGGEDHDTAQPRSAVGGARVARRRGLGAALNPGPGGHGLAGMPGGHGGGGMFGGGGGGGGGGGDEDDDDEDDDEDNMGLVDEEAEDEEGADEPAGLTAAERLLLAGRAAAAAPAPSSSPAGAAVTVPASTATAWWFDVVAHVAAGLPPAGASAAVARVSSVPLQLSVKELAASEEGRRSIAKIGRTHGRMLRLLAAVARSGHGGGAPEASSSSSAAAPDSTDDAASWGRLLTACRRVPHVAVGGCGLASPVLEAWLATLAASHLTGLPLDDVAGIADAGDPSRDELCRAVDPAAMASSTVALDVSASPSLGLGSLAKWVALCPRLKVLLADAGTGTAVPPGQGADESRDAAAAGVGGRPAAIARVGSACAERPASLGAHAGTYDDVGRLAFGPCLAVLALPALSAAAVHGLIWGLSWRPAELTCLHVDAAPDAVKVSAALQSAVPGLLSLSVGRGGGGTPWTGGVVVTPSRARSGVFGAGDAAMATSWDPAATATTPTSSPSSSSSSSSSASAAPRAACGIPATPEGESSAEALLSTIATVPARRLRVLRLLDARVDGPAGLRSVRDAFTSIRGRKTVHNGSTLAVLRVQGAAPAPLSDLVNPMHRTALARRRSAAVVKGRAPASAFLQWGICRFGPTPDGARRGVRPGRAVNQVCKSQHLMRRIFDAAGLAGGISTPLLDLAVAGTPLDAEREPLWECGVVPAPGSRRTAVPTHLRAADLARRQRSAASHRANATDVTKRRRPAGKPVAGPDLGVGRVVLGRRA